MWKFRYHIPVYSRISRSAYKSTPYLDVENIQILTPAYKLTLEWDLRLQAAGGDVRTAGRMAVAELPAACRQRRDTAAATCDDAVETGRWVVCGWWRRADVTGEEHRSLPVGVGASAANSVSSAVTVIDQLCRHLACISRRLSAVDLQRQLWKSCW